MVRSNTNDKIIELVNAKINTWEARKKNEDESRNTAFRANKKMDK